MTSNRERVIDYFNQCDIDYRIIWGTGRNLSLHFGFYDENHKKHDEALINMNRVLARTAKISSTDKILDAGCGIGGSAIWLAKNFGANVIGINISDKQIKTAEKLAEKNKASSLVKFAKRDFTDTKFPKDSFDVAWFLESSCYAEDKKSLASEARRVLKKGGRLVLADGFLKKKNLTKKEEKEMNSWLSGWAIPNLATPGELRKYLEESGFRNI